MRVVSLLASATETVCALEAGHLLVGRSHECDYPPEVQNLPQCSRPRMNVNTDGKSVDRAIRALLRENLSIYEVFEETLVNLKPDVILTQDHCRVCAVSFEEVRIAAQSILGSHVEVVSLHPHSFDDVWKDILRIAEALEQRAQGVALVTFLKDQLGEIESSLESQKSRQVLFIEWVEPLFIAGNWIPDLLHLAAAHPALVHSNLSALNPTWEEIQQIDPDTIIVAPCGLSLEQTLAEMAQLKCNPHWQNLSAVCRGDVYVSDGNQFFNRPGPRLVDSVVILREILHPEYTGAKLRGKHWTKFDNE